VRTRVLRLLTLKLDGHGLAEKQMDRQVRRIELTSAGGGDELRGVGPDALVAGRGYGRRRRGRGGARLHRIWQWKLPVKHRSRTGGNRSRARAPLPAEEGTDRGDLRPTSARPTEGEGEGEGVAPARESGRRLWRRRGRRGFGEGLPLCQCREVRARSVKNPSCWIYSAVSIFIRSFISSTVTCCTRVSLLYSLLAMLATRCIHYLGVTLIF
jgi:hypothetical protein